jgi:hypothetical protein
LSMSGKKSSLGKTSSSWASVMKKPSVVTQSAPQKPYRLSPVQDRKRRVQEAYYPGSQCTPQDGMGKTVEVAQCLGTRRQWMLYVVYSQR